MVLIVSDPLSSAAVAGYQLSEPEATPWGPVAAVLLCLLPLALLLLVTLSRRLLLPSSTSLPLAAAIMAVVRLAYLSSPPLFVMGSVVRGVLESATPLSVIYGAVLLFEVMQHTKCLSWLMIQVKSLSAGEPLAEVFLIGWAFSYMISGVGGFNTPIALSAPMLSSLGHDPMLSLLVVVMLNTLASHMGSVGMAIWFGFKSLDLGQGNILLICLKSSIIVGVLSCIIAPISASFLVPWRQLMRCSLFVFLSISSAVIPTALVAIFNAEFPVLIGGLCSMIITTLLIHCRVGLGPKPQSVLPESIADILPDTRPPATTAATAAGGPLSPSSIEYNSSGCSKGDFWQKVRRALYSVGGGTCRVLGRGHTAVSDGEGDIMSHHSGSSANPNIPGHSTLDRPLRLVAPPTAATAAVQLSDISRSNRVLFPAGNPDQAGCGSVCHQGDAVSAADDIETGSSFDNTAAAAAATTQSQALVGSAADLHDLATVSCPVDRHSITHPWDASDNAESDSGSNPIGGLGCEGLWEDNHSAMTTALPASLVAATIHHAALSGVSRVPWFAGVGAGLMHAAVSVMGRQQQQQQQHFPIPSSQQQGESSAASVEQSSHSSSEMQEAESAGLQPLVQGLNLEYELMAPDLDSSSPHPAAAAAAAMGSEFAHHYRRHQQQQHEQQQHQWWQTLFRLSQHKRKHHRKKGKRGLPAVRDIFWRTLPIWLTVLLLLLTRIPQLRIQAALQSIEPSVVVHLGTLGILSLSPSLVIQLKQVFTLQGVNWKYEVLYVPCLLPFVVASLVTLVVHRSNMREQQLSWSVPFVHAAQKMRGTFSAIIGAMVLSELISSGGVSSPAFIIGYQLSTWLGRGYLAVAGFLGALGSFVSGSVMAGNMTFGAIQKVAAERIGVSVTSMLAVQTAGSCAGKMMCISNILSAKILMHLQTMREGKIIRRTAPLVGLFVLLSQGIGLLFSLGGVWPDAAMG